MPLRFAVPAFCGLCVGSTTLRRQYCSQMLYLTCECVPVVPCAVTMIPMGRVPSSNCTTRSHTEKS